MATGWTLYGPKPIPNQITYNEVYQVINLLSQTSKVHRERDLRRITPEDMRGLVNNSIGGQNYHMMNCRADTVTKVIDIVIAYHYMKELKQWSVSIGLDRGVLPKPSATGTTFTKAYEDLAIEIGTLVKSDGAKFNPVATSFVMIDDVHKDAMGIPTTNGFEPEATQRLTMIGELVWTAMKSPNVSNKFPSATWNVVKGARPLVDGYCDSKATPRRVI